MALTLTIDELEAEWRPISQAEEVTMNGRIAKAISMLRLKLPSLDHRVDENTDLMVVAKSIVVDMVRRASTKTDDSGPVTSEMKVAGPFTSQRTYANPNGDMYVLDKEIALLQPTSGSGVGTIWTPPRR